VFSENKDVTGVSKEDINRKLSLPNKDLMIDDVEKMLNKPRMAATNSTRRSMKMSHLTAR
jgi:predicted NodU family carbamoyl transferase